MNLEKRGKIKFGIIIMISRCYLTLKNKTF